jgi:hypothetical protein
VAASRISELYINSEGTEFIAVQGIYPQTMDWNDEKIVLEDSFYTNPVLFDKYAANKFKFRLEDVSNVHLLKDSIELINKEK